MQKFTLSLVLALLATFVSLNISAQQTEICGTDQEYQRMLELNPELIQAEKDYEKSIQQYLQFAQAKDGDEELIIIPIVFHILHEYGAENISDAQIYDALNILNEDFRKLNVDTIEINPEFKDIAIDAKIQFRMANKKPDGSCTNGINRIPTIMTNDGYNSNVKFEQWTRRNYLNIWVVKTINSTVLGYATFPSGVDDPYNSKLDGVVILNSTAGTIGTGSTSYYSRTLTHEVGHYLNLQHPWGNGAINTFCGDDNVEDTPITKGWNNFCPNHEDSDVCESGVFENYQNYMDYSSCPHMFTAGQVARMRATLASPMAQRNHLWSSQSHENTGVDRDEPIICTPKVDFHADRNSRYACIGQPIQFSPEIGNAGAETYAWSFPGADIETSNDLHPTVTYNTPGWKSVTLTAGNSSGSGTLTKEQAIYIYAGSISVDQFVETFENENQVNNQWVAGNANNNKLSSGVNWQWSPIGCLEPGSMKLNTFDNPSPEPYEFISPKLNLEGKAGQFISFKYAFATQHVNPDDVKTQLRVLSSLSCGRSRSVRFTMNNAADILTGGSFSDIEFEPSQPGFWKTAVIEINNSLAQDGTQLIFEVTSSFGENNFYIDDINVGSWIVSTEDEELVHTLNLYPNPANSLTHLDFTINHPSAMDISIYDLTGKQVKFIASANYPTGMHSIEIPTGDLSAGAYIVHLKGNEINKSIKLMIGR